jgi:hypothetical protein
MSALGSKLKKLYGLAIIRPSEEKDEARQNEARNAAYLLLKLARDNNVQIKFVIAAASPPQETSQGYARYSPPSPSPQPARKASPFYDHQRCPCGKSLETRTWYAAGAGCTHVTTS